MKRKNKVIKHSTCPFAILKIY